MSFDLLLPIEDVEDPAVTVQKSLNRQATNQPLDLAVDSAPEVNGLLLAVVHSNDSGRWSALAGHVLPPFQIAIVVEPYALEPNLSLVQILRAHVTPLITHMLPIPSACSLSGIPLRQLLTTRNCSV